MRTIKFRGKCAKDSRYSGEWVYGACVQCEKSNDVLIIYAINDRNSCSYHVDPDTVGQFTGLYDKNGNEIYEGDILRYPAEDKFDEENFVSFEVFWHDNDFADKHSDLENTDGASLDALFDGGPVKEIDDIIDNLQK